MPEFEDVICGLWGVFVRCEEMEEAAVPGRAGTLEVGRMVVSRSAWWRGISLRDGTKASFSLCWKEAVGGSMAADLICYERATG